METKTIACSFCGRSEEACTHMIAGDNAVICNYCVVECATFLLEQLKGGEQPLPLDVMM